MFSLLFRCLLYPYVFSEEICCSIDLAEENAAFDSISPFLVLCDPATLTAVGSPGGGVPDPKVASCFRID